MTVSMYDGDYNLLDIPRFRGAPRKLNDDDSLRNKLESLRTSIAKIQEILNPATLNEMKEHLGRLLIHKGRGNYNEEHWGVLMDDYIKFLSIYPSDLLEKSCNECICDASIQYFPQVGLLINKMKAEFSLRKMYLARLEKILELSIGSQEIKINTPQAKQTTTALAAKLSLPSINAVSEKEHKIAKTVEYLKSINASQQEIDNFLRNPGI